MSALRSLALILMTGASLAACSTMKPALSNRLPAPQASAPEPGTLPAGKGGVYKVGKPYQVGGLWYVPREDPNYDATGVSSWYGDSFHLKATANGETFDMNAVSAAHTTLPLPSMVEVTNLDNGKRLVVRVNDRGPFVGGRILDVSKEAARQLGYDRQGTANVRVRYIGPAPLGVGDGTRMAAAAPPQASPLAVAAPAAPISAQPLPPAAAPPRGYAASAPVYAPTSAPVYAPTSAPGYASPPYATYPAPAYPVAAPPTVYPAATAPTLPPRPATPGPGLYKVQAAAFSDPGAAQKVARELAGAGDARVELGERDGAAIYRVMVQASADEGEAWALRDRVAAYGYADARVIRPF